MNIKLYFSYIPFYLLILSSFQASIIIQYAALAILVFFFLFKNRPVIKKNIFFSFSVLIVCFAFLSYLYNFVAGNADRYTIIFWLFSYLPPFVLIWLTISYSRQVDFYNIYHFYKLLVYLQSFLLIFSTFKYHKFIVGDPATGTVGDANWVAFHICVVLIYEIVKLVVLSKHNSFSWKENINSVVEIIYFIIVFLIPESTANLGFLFIIIGVLFFREYIFAHASLKGILVFLICCIIGFYLLSDNFVYKRIQSAVHNLVEDNIDKNPYLFKASIYKKIINGDIYKDINSIVGSGPSTFTSRSSVIRMPEERVNNFPIELPYFKSSIFAKYISPMYAQWRASGESYGNFASPQATVISIAVELGIVGLFLFVSYFYFIVKAINNTELGPEQMFLKKFANYFSLFFILSLFHLNFWEYPIVCFIYCTFTFLIIKSPVKQAVLSN